LSHSKTHIAHCDIISLMIIAHNSPNGWTAAIWVWLLRRSRSFKVTDFDTNQKLACDFLLVINTNLAPILHHFQVMADYWSNSR